MNIISKYFEEIEIYHIDLIYWNLFSNFDCLLYFNIHLISVVYHNFLFNTILAKIGFQASNTPTSVVVPLTFHTFFANVFKRARKSIQ